jgi:glycosyltransferase involved in cell wall biosynthesis
MSKERLIELYRSSDIFVMASFTESFGLVYAEAMSQNLPVIYTKGQGFDNQFDEGVVGYHVSAKDPEDVAEGIKCIIDNYSEIQKNLVRSAGEFSWTRIVEKYDRIYKAINR